MYYNNDFSIHFGEYLKMLFDNLEKRIRVGKKK